MRTDTLKPELIVETIGKLHQRIEERFPNSGLKNVCLKLHQISKNMQAKADWIGKPVRWLRVLTWIICVVVVVVALIPFFYLAKEGGLSVGTNTGVTDVVTLMEAGINDVVLIGAAIFFLLTIETRYKRQRALKATSRAPINRARD